MSFFLAKSAIPIVNSARIMFYMLCELCLILYTIQILGDRVIQIHKKPYK